MSIGQTFEEQYENFFKFFNDNHSIEEITDFIITNDIPSFSPYKQIHLNMIDSKNFNILFYIILKSLSDEDCLKKLKLLIEEYHVNYKVFDFNYQRRIPFYTCIKGYLESTKYIIEKLNYNIELMDNREQTLFFSAFKSYNLELVKYLDRKFPNYIFFPDSQYNSCIYDIFKKDMNKPEESKKFENVLKFIINRGFDIFEENIDNISFYNKCEHFKKLDVLEKIIKEIGGEYEEKYFRRKKRIDNDSNCMDIDDNNSKENNNIKNDINIKDLKINDNIENNNEAKINNTNIKINNNVENIKDLNINMNIKNINNEAINKDAKINMYIKNNNNDIKIKEPKINNNNNNVEYKDNKNDKIIKNDSIGVKINNNKNIKNENIINSNNINNLINDMSHYIDSHNSFLEKIKSEKKEKLVIKEIKEFNENKIKNNSSDSNLRKNQDTKNKSKDIKNPEIKKQTQNWNINEQKNLFEGINNNWSIKISINQINLKNNNSNQSDNNIINNINFSNINISNNDNNNNSIEKIKDNLSKKMNIETNFVNNKNNNNFSKNLNEFPIKNFNDIIDRDKIKNKTKGCIFLNRKTNFIRDIEKIRKAIKNNEKLNKFLSKLRK